MHTWVFLDCIPTHKKAQEGGPQVHPNISSTHAPTTTHANGRASSASTRTSSRRRRTHVGSRARYARARPALTVIWATSTPGGCGKAPLATLHRGVDRSAFFNWGEFLARDAVAKAFFARQGAQFRVLDLEPLHYRQDAHVAEDDCLHLCIPGPLNAIVPPLLTRVLGGFIVA